MSEEELLGIDCPRCSTPMKAVKGVWTCSGCGLVIDD